MVVCDDLCCCYACGNGGDLLVLRKPMVVCVCFGRLEVVVIM